MNMDWRTRIISNPDILLGKSTIKGTRISVELVLGCFASEWSFDDILKSYPHITREDILAALAYARHIASTRQLIEQVPGEETTTMDEIRFVVEELPERGFVARAVGLDIFTEANDLPSLRVNAREAVRCHFGEGLAPRLIRLHITHEEVLSV
jgi:uncharacterized protein (DUF433 family)